MIISPMLDPVSLHSTHGLLRERYDVAAVQPTHMSQDCIVVYATDTGPGVDGQPMSATSIVGPSWGAYCMLIAMCLSSACPLLCQPATHADPPTVSVHAGF